MSETNTKTVVDDLPFFIRGIRAGTITGVQQLPGFRRGKLSLEPCDQWPVFDQVVKLARLVDLSSPQEYQAAWQRWNDYCWEIQDLQLRIGNEKGPVEEFTIESDWSIEWRDMEIDTSRI